MPRTSNRNAPMVPASKSPMPGTVTVASSGRFSTWVWMASSSTPSPSASTRTTGPHTICSETSMTIGGVESIGCPNPTSSRTASGWS